MDNTDRDVIKLNYELNKLIQKPSYGPRRRAGIAMDLLKQLHQKPVTLDLLMKTKVGVTVNKSRVMFGREVGLYATQLINHWSLLIPIREDKPKNGNRRKSSKPTKRVTIREPHKDNGDNGRDDNKENERPKTKDKDNGKDAVEDRRVFIKKSELEKKRKMIENRSKMRTQKLNQRRNQQLFQHVIKKYSTVTDNQQRPEFWASKLMALQMAKQANKQTNKKLPPIGQLPQYSAKRLRDRESDINLDVKPYYLQPSTSKATASTSRPSPSATVSRAPVAITSRARPATSGLSGHNLYESIIESRKRQNDEKREKVAKKLKGNGMAGHDLWTKPVPYNPLANGKPKVQNWPVPKTQPFITPIDRLKIVQSRSNDKPNPETKAEPVFKDPNDLELNISRVRSAKVFGRNVKRVEHRPTWLPK